MSSVDHRQPGFCRSALWAGILFLSAAAQADDSTVMLVGGVKIASGEQIYAHICQGCHMPQAQGAIGAGHYPKLAADPALSSWQYAALTVLGGRNGMPAFGWPAEEPMPFGVVRLSDQQVAEVVNFVRSHFGNRYPGTVTAAQVAALPHPAP